MKLTLIPALLLAAFAGPTAAIRFEAEGVRVGSELVTGAAVRLKESMLVSGSAVESLSGESLSVSLGGKQVDLGAGLRLARTADGFRLTSHGMAFKVEASGASLAADREASFKVTEKGFDFGALGTLEGATFAARVSAPAAPVVAADPQQVEVSPAKPFRQGRAKRFYRLFHTDPLTTGNAATGVVIRLMGRVSADAAP